MGVGAESALFHSTAFSHAIISFNVFISISTVFSVLANLSYRLMISKDWASTDFCNTCTVSPIELAAFAYSICPSSWCIPASITSKGGRFSNFSVAGSRSSSHKMPSYIITRFGVDELYFRFLCARSGLSLPHIIFPFIVYEIIYEINYCYWLTSRVVCLSGISVTDSRLSITCSITDC